MAWKFSPISLIYVLFIVIELTVSMLDFALMLWVKWPVVDKIDPQSYMFASGVEYKVTGDSKLNESADNYMTVQYP